MPACLRLPQDCCGWQGDSSSGVQACNPGNWHTWLSTALALRLETQLKSLHWARPLPAGVQALRTVADELPTSILKLLQMTVCSEPDERCLLSVQG